jgi:hypothetical protein
MARTTLTHAQVLDQLVTLRKGLGAIRAEQRSVYVELAPGRTIDLLDGETERLLDEIEALAKAGMALGEP